VQDAFVQDLKGHNNAYPLERSKYFIPSDLTDCCRSPDTCNTVQTLYAVFLHGYGTVERLQDGRLGEVGHSTARRAGEVGALGLRRGRSGQEAAKDGVDHGIPPAVLESFFLRCTPLGPWYLALQNGVLRAYISIGSSRSRCGSMRGGPRCHP